MIVPAIALVDVSAPDLDAGQRRGRREHRSECVAVVRIAVQGLGVQHELTAFRPMDRRRDRHDVDIGGLKQVVVAARKSRVRQGDAVFFQRGPGAALVAATGDALDHS